MVQRHILAKQSEMLKDANDRERELYERVKTEML
jgi:hypothetical protein